MDRKAFIAARSENGWRGLLAPLGAALFLVGGQTAYIPLMVAGTTCMLIGLGIIGLRVLLTPDTEWALTPVPSKPGLGSASIAASTATGG